jgi:acyl-coenzyme A thioesterase 13
MEGLLKQCHIVEVKPGYVVFGGFKVQDEHLNMYGTLHGGVSATLIDMVSSFALVKEEMELPNFGVSVDLNLS